MLRQQVTHHQIKVSRSNVFFSSDVTGCLSTVVRLFDPKEPHLTSFNHILTQKSSIVVSIGLFCSCLKSDCFVPVHFPGFRHQKNTFWPWDKSETWESQVGPSNVRMGFSGWWHSNVFSVYQCILGGLKSRCSIPQEMWIFWITSNLNNVFDFDG